MINTRNKLLLDKLFQKHINVGSIEGISQKNNTYLDQGVLIQMTANVYKIDTEDK